VNPAASDDPVTVARHILPQYVQIAGGLIAALQGHLYPAERAAIAGAVPARRAAYTAGRTAARIALTASGAAPGALPPAPDGPPLWPPGLTGSISHGGDWCLAVSAPLTDCVALGIDIEPLVPLDPAIVAEIATPAELALPGFSFLPKYPRGPGAAPPEAATLQNDRQFRALVLFSAKEAAYKAQFMLTRTMLDFDDLTAFAAVDATISLRLNRAAGPLRAGHVLVVRQTIAQELLISAIVLPAYV